MRKKIKKKVSKCFEVSNISLSETELANDCQKVRPKFGRSSAEPNFQSINTNNSVVWKFNVIKEASLSFWIIRKECTASGRGHSIAFYKMAFCTYRQNHLWFHTLHHRPPIQCKCEHKIFSRWGNPHFTLFLGTQAHFAPRLLPMLAYVIVTLCIDDCTLNRIFLLKSRSRCRLALLGHWMWHLIYVEIYATSTYVTPSSKKARYFLLRKFPTVKCEWKYVWIYLYVQWSEGHTLPFR